MIFDTLTVGALQVNCYILGCEQTRQAIVVDPGDNPKAILAGLRSHDLILARIIATHAHFDHLLAARPLQEATGAPFTLHPAERPILLTMRSMTMAWMGYDPGAPPRCDSELLPGQPVIFGAEVLEVRLTRGHSPGGVTFVHHASRRALFAGGIGRTDLPGGNMQTLLAAIRDQILTLPDDYAVLSGHGLASTIGEERRSNPFLAEDG
jgi:hydroxyacylglutathione hydrolase